MATTVYIVNSSSNTYDLVVRGLPIHIPAHRRKDNPAPIRIREDLLPALLGSLKKRSVLRVLPSPEESEPVETPDPDQSDKEGQTISDAVQTDRAAFFTATKAAKKADGVWNLTLPNGEEMEIEAEHHKKAKEIAFEMLYGAGE